AGFEKNPVEIVEIFADQVLADHVLLRLEQKRRRNRLADLAGDRKVRIARIDAVIQRVRLQALPEFPVIGHVGRLRRGAAKQGTTDEKRRQETKHAGATAMQLAKTFNYDAFRPTRTT